ncbi:MAG: sugar phosphate nucleotidyltransferase [Acidobacteriota bacterium]
MGDRRDPIGVILAAGAGARIRPLSHALPKPLLPVCNKPIAQHQLEAMRAIGIQDFRFVVSPLDDKVRGHFGDGSRFGVRVSYVVQSEQLGIAHAVLQCEETVDRPVLVFLGDVYIVPKDLATMVGLLGSHAMAVLAVRREDDPVLMRRNFTVALRDDGTVARVIEKPRHPANNLKGCGIYLFDLPAFDSIRRTPKTAMRDEYEITNSIQLLIDDGHPVRVAEVVEWDMNVTSPCDLLACNRWELARRKLGSLVGADVRLASGAAVPGSVVGDGASIVHPITVKDCLVFPGTRVDSRGDLEAKILTPEVIISCDARVEG